MAEAHALHKLIYLSLRETFAGPSHNFRKKKTVKKLLEQQKDKPQIRNLIQKGYDIDRISNIAHALIQEHIFESTTKAKARFPEVFATSVSLASAPKPSEHKPVTPIPKPSEHKPITPAPYPSEHKATISSLAPAENVELQPANNEIETDQEYIKITETKLRSRTPPQTSNLTIAPDSVYLPFWYQHRIMVQVQTTLEKACFRFALRNLNDVVQKNAWECAEAIELNRWPKILLDHQDNLNQRIPGDMGKSLPDLLTSINQIRHAAVHRLRLPARSALDLTTDAEALAKLLKDDVSIEMISTIRRHIAVATEDLGATKHSLESRLSEIRKEYTAKKIQLAREEAELIESTKEESRENDFFANANPDDTLDAIFAAQARWKQRGSVSLSTHETCGPEKRHELDLETGAVYDHTMSVDERAEASGVGVSISESQPTLSEGSDGPFEDPNADLYDLDMPNKMRDTSGDHPERPKAVEMFNQPDLCLRAYAADGLPKLHNGLHSPSTSECEYWATPCGSRSPTEEAAAMDGFKDHTATSE